MDDGAGRRLPAMLMDRPKPGACHLGAHDAGSDQKEAT